MFFYSKLKVNKLSIFIGAVVIIISCAFFAVTYCLADYGLFINAMGTAGHDYGKVVAEVADGYLWAGDSEGGFLLVKTDLTGAIVWEKKYTSIAGFPLQLISMVESPTTPGQFVLAGYIAKARSYMFALKFDSNDETIKWANSYYGMSGCNCDVYLQSIHAMSGGYYLTGAEKYQIGFYNLIALKIDEDGIPINKIRRFRYDLTATEPDCNSAMNQWLYADKPYILYPRENGEFILAGWDNDWFGTYYIFSDSGSDPIFHRTWGFIYEDPNCNSCLAYWFIKPQSIIEQGDATYIAGHKGIVKIVDDIFPPKWIGFFFSKGDPNLPGFSWQAYSTSGTPGNYGKAIAFNSVNSKLIITGYYDYNSSSDIDFMMAEINKSNGAMQWKKYINGENNDEGNFVAVGSRGNYLVGGRTKSFSAGGVNDLLMISSDRYGEISECSMLEDLADSDLLYYADDTTDRVINNIKCPAACSTCGCTEYLTYEDDFGYNLLDCAVMDDENADDSYIEANHWGDIVESDPSLSSQEYCTLSVVEPNMTGWAWSENIGWISFSHRNCDDNFDGWGDGSPGCPGSGTAIPTYGVKLDWDTNIFSGYAWSAAGWISFQESEVPDLDGNPANDYDFNSYCDINLGDCNGSEDNCTACYDFDNGNVYGWAKIIALGDDGWIKLGTDDDREEVDNWGFKLANCASEGWGWNGNGQCNDGSGITCADDSDCTGGGTCEIITGVGWIEFSDIDAGGDPLVVNLTAPNWARADACTTGALGAFLTWNYQGCPGLNGDSLGAYQVIIDDENIAGSPGATPVLDTGKCTGQYTCEGCSDPNLCQIGINCLTTDPPSTCSYPIKPSDGILDSYDASYYWWVKVWDDTNAESELTQFDASIDEVGINDHVLTDNEARNQELNLVDPELTFTTYKHEFPEFPPFREGNPDPPAFDIIPIKPSELSEAIFADNYVKVFSKNPSGDLCSKYCTGDDCNFCSWQWRIPIVPPPNPLDQTPKAQDDEVWIENRYASSTKMIFKSTNEKQVYLIVKDEDDYYCWDYRSVKPKFSLPVWKEVKSE